ncbi:hypothetical protein L916_02966 [Phytophthora nicotianae]|uniref:Uncharacterized protein n=1 Tax=Phytophthora nicotianae TaxID=4792 RepID=W2JNS9_PHYNI|nr:hypothetical protein L916_02966 [Phytophthora nicotianae]
MRNLTTCEAFPSKGGSGDEGQNLSTKSETIVAYIQNMKRAFVVVGPDSGICEMFDLKGAPDANTFLTMISCFNPEQLERELS